MFPSMAALIPECSKGAAKVSHFDVDGYGSAMSSLRPGEYVPEGRYAKLHVNGSLMMSDTRMEHYTNYDVVRHAHGNVLIAGLGLGMILTRILPKENVASVLVVEQCQDVIDLIAPHHACHKLSVVCADIFEWKPARSSKWNCIYFDIWSEISTDTLDEMTKLHRRFARNLDRADSACWMSSWRQSFLRNERRREKSQSW